MEKYVLSFVAIMTLFAAVYFMVKNRRMQSPFVLRQENKNIAQYSEVVDARVIGLEWKENGCYMMKCAIEGVSESIELPAPSNLVQDVLMKRNSLDRWVVPLACIETTEEKVYFSVPDECPYITGDFVVHSQEEVYQTNERVALWIDRTEKCLLMSAFFIPFIPILSISLSVAASFIFLRNRPLLSWKNSLSFYRIKKKVTKESAEQKQTPKQTPKVLPEDYDFWTPIQKELYTIEKKLEGRLFSREAPDKSGVSVLQEAAFQPSAQELVPLEPVSMENQTHEDGEQEASSACPHCGCVVNEDCSFCSQCGFCLREIHAEDYLQEKAGNEASCEEQAAFATPNEKLSQDQKNASSAQRAQKENNAGNQQQCSSDSQHRKRKKSQGHRNRSQKVASDSAKIMSVIEQK